MTPVAFIRWLIPKYDESPAPPNGTWWLKILCPPGKYRRVPSRYTPKYISHLPLTTTPSLFSWLLEDQWFPQGPTANESPHEGSSILTLNPELMPLSLKAKWRVSLLLSFSTVHQVRSPAWGMGWFQNVYAFKIFSSAVGQTLPHREVSVSLPFRARWALGAAGKCGADLGGSGSSTFWENHQSEIETGICLSITGIFHCALDWLFKVKPWRQHLFLNTRSRSDPSPGASFYWQWWTFPPP